MNNALTLVPTSEGQPAITELKLAEDIRLTPEEFKYFVGKTGWRYLKSRKVFYLSAKNKTEDEFKTAYFFVRKNFIPENKKAEYDGLFKTILESIYRPEEFAAFLKECDKDVKKALKASNARKSGKAKKAAAK